MKTRLLKLWDSLISSLWFVPVLMTGCVVVLAFGTLYLDTIIQSQDIRGLWFIYTGDAEGAREVLGVIASSMITVAGVVFSITIVALTLASQQFGPRLLRNFMRDTGNQVVLGTFIATFIFCVLVLRTARTPSTVGFVPSISVTMSVLLAMASLGVLIFFIHHIALSIQATTVIDRVHGELETCAKRLFPEMLGTEGETDRAPADVPKRLEEFGARMPSGGDGYIQAIVNEQIMALATSQDLVIELLPRPGDYLIKGQSIAKVWPPPGEDQTAARKIAECFVLGNQRTSTQDIRFVFDQLTEIAIRALSPGINDPHTAINCIDHLSSGLCLLAARKIPSPFRYDEEQRLRVIARPVTFVEISHLVFDPLRRYGSSSVSVLARMVETITTIAPFVQRSEDRKVLVQHVQLLQQAAGTLKQKSDRRIIEANSMAALEALA